MNEGLILLNKKEILEKLETTKNGLSNIECEKRLKKYGYNELPSSKKKSLLKIFISSFNDSIIYVLIFCSIVSYLIGEIVDGSMILFIILVDGIVSTIQEYSAHKNTEAMRDIIKIKTKVIRNNHYSIINSEEIVPGDIIILDAGTKVTADIKLINSKNITVDESILTGESIGIEKDSLSKNISSTILYAGTSILTGTGLGVVVYTGINTEIGKIALKVNNTEETMSPLAIRMQKFSKHITIIIIIISLIIATILYFKGEKIYDIFLSVVALSVSAMPEGLPLALTMALTIGSRKMFKRNVIVKKLNCVESLGSCTVIATDKTGTLTVNEQTAKKILLANDEEFDIDGIGYDSNGSIIPIDNSKIQSAKHIALLGVLNNDALYEKNYDGKLNIMGDSIDIAFKVLGEKLELTSNKYKILDSIPYESENKYSAVLYKDNEKIYCTAKGSFEKIISFCDYQYNGNRKKKINKDKLLKQNDYLASLGYRIIAICEKEANQTNDFNEKILQNMTFIGIVAFIDPVRKEVYNAIRKCKLAGIKVSMITGDYPLTAYSIAKELRICNNQNEIVTGDVLENITDQSIFDEYIKNKTVFARISPLMKLRIIESYKNQGEFVAVTGDGVNDAPAIKAANIGISMGNATDVTKETANMIIADNNFSSIVSGIEEGRNAYANIRKISIFLLSCGLSEVLFFILSIIFNLPMPLVAIQLLWLNIVSDGLQDISLSFETENDIVMKKKPISPKESIFEKELIKQVVISGLYMSLIVFGVWYFLINIFKFDLIVSRSYILFLMVFIQNFHVFNCRSETKSVFTNSINNNRFLIASIVITLLLQIIVSENDFLSSLLGIVTIPYLHLIILILLACPIIFIMEIYKSKKNN